MFHEPDMKPINETFWSHLERDSPNGFLESWESIAGNQGQAAVVSQRKLLWCQLNAIKGPAGSSQRKPQETPMMRMSALNTAILTRQPALITNVPMEETVSSLPTCQSCGASREQSRRSKQGWGKRRKPCISPAWRGADPGEGQNR